MNGVTTCAVAADVARDDHVESERILVENHDNSPLVTSGSKYTMQENVFPPAASSAGVNTTNNSVGTNNNANSTASYFNSFISGHRLSFSEDEDCDDDANDDDNGGLVIQEVMRSTNEFVGRVDSSAEQQKVFLEGHGGDEEKWTPFGSDHEHEDNGVVVEKNLEVG